MTTSNTHSLDYGKLAYDRTEIADTLYRYALGLDLGDADFLASAFTEDAVFDFTPAAKKLGMEFPIIESREVIVKSMLAAVGPLDTSHSATNMHITVKGDTATLKALVMAQHFRPGEGPRPDRTDHALLLNRYDAELVRDADTWRFSHLTIDNVWFEGDYAVVTSAT